MQQPQPETMNRNKIRRYHMAQVRSGRAHMGGEDFRPLPER